MECLLCASIMLGAGDNVVPQIHGSHNSVGETDMNQLLTQINVKMPLCQELGKNDMMLFEGISVIPTFSIITLIICLSHYNRSSLRAGIWSV